MTTIFKLKLGVIAFLLWVPLGIMAQTDLPQNLHINGLGRTIINNSNLAGDDLASDSTTVKDQLDGEFLLDLKVNATPNKNTEVQTILRLRNEFGGFFGAGMSVEVRELFARGVVADIFRYHVGDMDLSVSPYTLFQAEAEGRVNEAEIFRARRELIDYEQFFNRDGKRRMQGGKFDLGLSAGSFLPEINLMGFFTRIRGTDFFTLPTRFTAGGTVEFVNNRWGKARAHYVNTYDALSIGNFSSGIRNPIVSGELDLNILENEKLILGFTGELGFSQIRKVEEFIVRDTLLRPVDTVRQDAFFRGEVPDEGIISDTYFEGMFELALKEKNVNVGLGFRNVGPDFFSMGAQSKRVVFDRSASLYGRIGNQRFERGISLFDINRDRGLYQFGLSEVLMAFDPRLNNTMPYGAATPNRRGFLLNAGWGTDSSVVELGLTSAFMQEIRGQGTFELRSFAQARLSGNVYLNRLFSRKEALVLTLGYQFEQTNRGGNEIQQVDLTSHLVDAGLQVELFEGFDLLLGSKILRADGSEYLPEIVQFNRVRNFSDRLVFDDTEALLGGGFRYRFKEGVFLTAQVDRFSFANPEPTALGYQATQIFVLYNMNF